MLLEFIARRLAEQQRLPPARPDDVNSRSAPRLPEAERAAWLELAAVCERVRFSGREVPGVSLGAAIVGGKSLLASLGLRPAAAAHGG
jgi:hypothetical protein